MIKGGEGGGVNQKPVVRIMYLLTVISFFK